MKRASVAMCLFMAFFMVAAFAEASIIVTYQERIVDAEVWVTGQSEHDGIHEYTSLGYWDLDAEAEADGPNPGKNTAAASQTSNIDDSGDALIVVASGWTDVSITGSEGQALAESSIVVRFSVVDEPAYYILTGSGDLDQFDRVYSKSGGPSVPNGQGILAIGDYELAYDSYALLTRENGEIHESFSVDFTATSVPLPGTIWLLGSGLISMSWIRRKFKK